MSRIQQRTLFWNGRGKRATRDQPRAEQPVSSKYSFGNPELFQELYEVTSKFTPRQKELAVSTGFGLFVEERISVNFDQHFSLWLMSKVDHRQRSIIVNKAVNLRIFPEDINKVFGLPCGGKVPWHFSLDKSAKNINAVKNKIGIVGGSGSCSAAAETFLRNCNKEMSKEEDESFKVAFIIFVMSILRDAKTPTHWESENYLPALTNIDEVCSFDWSRCIYEDVFRMCTQAQSDTKKKLLPRPPAGCLLFLHIFYLDNMDYGDISPTMDVVPRAKIFDAERISRLIMEDCIGLKGAPPTRVFGARKLRPTPEVVYKRQIVGATGTQGNVPETTTKRQRADACIPENAAKTTHDGEAVIAVKAFKAKCLKVLTTARMTIEAETDSLVEELARIQIKKSPLHDRSDSISNASTLQLNINSINSCTPPPPCTPEEGTTDKPLTPQPPKPRGYTHHDFEAPSFDLFDDVENVKTSPNVSNQPINRSPLFNSPPRKTRRQEPVRSPLKEIKSVSKSFLEAKRAIEEINLNDTTSEMEFFHSPVIKKVAKPGVYAKPPWKVTDGPPRRERHAARSFYEWAVANVNEDNSVIWVRHDTPKFVEISSADLVNQLRTGGSVAPDTCDAVIRTFAQTEQRVGSKSSWRHFLETDFSSVSVRQQFAGDHMDYDISHCQLFFCLAMIEKNWTAIAWDMKRKQITAYAPGFRASGKKNPWASHSEAIDTLHSAMKECIEEYFVGWRMCWDNWPKVLLECNSQGQDMRGNHWPERVCNSTAAREELMFDLMHLRGNTALEAMETVMQRAVDSK
ncbi:hypothetical protein ACP70R_020151 [Stipagrostis hirtigluma subsp. patula]